MNNTGVDATGQAFNSIVAIEQMKGHEMNPLVNAGAIAATSMVPGESYGDIWKRIRTFRWRMLLTRYRWADESSPSGVQ
jgi:glutaminase